MPNWTTITVADVKNTKAASLIERLGDAALGEGQADPTSEIIANVTARIRAEIAGCTKNELDEDTSKIPNDLKSLACRLMYVELAGRCRVSLTNDESTLLSQDIRYLERIAGCEVPVATPDNPAGDPEISGAAAIPLINTKTRYFNRNDGF